MKYLVKNRKTGEETLCEKVGVDGFDYYIVNKLPNAKDYFITRNNGLGQHNGAGIILFKDDRKVIATTNKSLDLPQVVDEVEELASKAADSEECFNNVDGDYSGYYDYIEGFQVGYNKAEETYQFTKYDMVEFTDWIFVESFKKGTSDFTTSELLDIWQQQRIIKIEVE